MKLLGIDYGEKRIGLAIAENSWAKPIGILVNKSKQESINNIKNIIERENIKKIIFGLAETFSGKERPYPTWYKS